MDKLAIINNIEVVETDSDGECLYYVYIENNDENRAILLEIGAGEKEIEDVTDDTEGTIDIAMIVFNNTNAQWFQESLGGFIDYVPDHAPDYCKVTLQSTESA